MRPPAQNNHERAHPPTHTSTPHAGHPQTDPHAQPTTLLSFTGKRETIGVGGGGRGGGGRRGGGRGGGGGEGGRERGRDRVSEDRRRERACVTWRGQ